MQPINPKEMRLEFAELLDSLSSSGKHAENIEADLFNLLAICLFRPPLENVSWRSKDIMVL